MARKAARTTARITACPCHLLALPPDLIDLILCFLWPYDLRAVATIQGACRLLQTRLPSVGWMIAEQLCVPPLDFPADLPFLHQELRLAEQHSLPSLQIADDAAVMSHEEVIRFSHAISALKLRPLPVIAQHAPLLLRLLRKPDQPKVFTLAAHALRRLGTNWNQGHALEALNERLKDDNCWARIAALKTLQSFQGHAITPAIAHIVACLSFTGETSLVRKYAVECLEKADKGTAKLALENALTALLQNEDEGVQRSVRHAARVLSVDIAMHMPDYGSDDPLPQAK